MVRSRTLLGKKNRTSCRVSLAALETSRVFSQPLKQLYTIYLTFNATASLPQIPKDPVDTVDHLRQPTVPQIPKAASKEGEHQA